MATQNLTNNAIHLEINYLTSNANINIRDCCFFVIDEVEHYRSVVDFVTTQIVVLALIKNRKKMNNHVTMMMITQIPMKYQTSKNEK